MANYLCIFPAPDSHIDFLTKSLNSGDITKSYSDSLRAKIDKYRSAPNKASWPIHTRSESK